MDMVLARRRPRLLEATLDRGNPASRIASDCGAVRLAASRDFVWGAWRAGPGGGPTTDHVGGFCWGAWRAGPGGSPTTDHVAGFCWGALAAPLAPRGAVPPPLASLGSV